MTRDVDLLCGLKDVAETLLYRPAADIATARLVGLRENVRAAAQRPAPDGRHVTDFAALLADVTLKLATCRRHRRDLDAVRWAQIAGVLLPIVGTDLDRAIEAAHRPSPRPD